MCLFSFSRRWEQRRLAGWRHHRWEKHCLSLTPAVVQLKGAEMGKFGFSIPLAACTSVEMHKSAKVAWSGWNTSSGAFTSITFWHHCHIYNMIHTFPSISCLRRGCQTRPDHRFYCKCKYPFAQLLPLLLQLLYPAAQLTSHLTWKIGRTWFILPSMFS